MRRRRLAALAIAPLGVVGCYRPAAEAPRAEAERARAKLDAAANETERFYALGDAAKSSFEIGDFDAAQLNARELLSMAPRFKADWNYGNAVHDANVVLGRVAVRAGRTKDGVSYLRAAGATPGSPQLNSFGPNMSLANDLIARGEEAAVLEYFQACKAFWRSHGGRLDLWALQVRIGMDPWFGANFFH